MLIQLISFLALPLWGLLIVWRVYERFFKKKDVEKEEDDTKAQENGVNIVKKKLYSFTFDVTKVNFRRIIILAHHIFRSFVKNFYSV